MGGRVGDGVAPGGVKGGWKGGCGVVLDRAAVSLVVSGCLGYRDPRWFLD